ncbi:GNAT family N-acetyltransferase [Amnibacterium flavum]|uniref:GNAT family N-acetyltransferase n=1 Tax=Amnibacterium flavum TaxID=2173173 RepID=UPI001402E082|nr:GNAT family N-acetyltransferase [Amnibacterium flavum]
MQPVVLRTERLVLDQPTDADIDAIAEYCDDPLFERFMTLPSPYARTDAEQWVLRVVPGGWAAATDLNWVIRTAPGGRLVGAIGHRAALTDVGFWLGRPHRGHGYMTEAVGSVIDWLFSRGIPTVQWECLEGNRASAAVARRAGFRFTGIAPSDVTARDGTHPPAWHGERDRTDRGATARSLASWPEWTS